MDIYERTGYLDICIGYRIISITLTTAVYLSLAIYEGTQTPGKWWIAFGMLASCFLGCRLYRKMDGQEGWTRVTLGLELFAYGIFTFLSGGLFSPYLWYCLGCLLIMMTEESRMAVIPMGALWCLLCVTAGRVSGRITYQEINICLGMITVMGGFYVLRCYIGCLDWQRHKLRLLNQQLSEEKEWSDQTFFQLTNLYETFNLFAMTNPDQIVNELTVLLRRIIAPRGCVLVKVDTDGSIERLGNSGIDGKNARTLAGEVLLNGWSWNYMETDEPHYFNLETSEDTYEVMVIGGGTSSRGIFIRLSADTNQVSEGNQSFYMKLIGIVFYNMDIHNQIERYITTEEQNRIANEIHDTVIQKLFGMACNMKVMELELEQMDKEHIRNKIEQLKQSAELTIKELREAIYGRRFENGAGDSFIASLKCYIEEAERLSDAAITLMIEKEAEDLTAAQKITVYRIACEAVNNAIRHGRADQIEVRLIVDDEQIKTTIKDNGLGFSKTQLPICEGRGLKNMRRMAGMLKGHLILEPQNENGATITLSIPR